MVHNKYEQSIKRRHSKMANKFEGIIEAIINEDQKKATALFHQIVVERSRKIYEDLEQEDNTDNFMDEIEHEENNNGEEDQDHSDFSDEEGNVDDADFGDEVGGDEQDDLIDDTSVDGLGDFHEDGEEAPDAVEDRIVDLEDSMDELKAEFDRIVNGGDDADDSDDDFDAEDDNEDFDSEDSNEDSDFGGDDDTEDESEDDDTEDFGGGEDESEDESEDDDSDDEDEDDEEEEDAPIREYVEKVAKPSNSETEGTNKKSTVAGKNDMGGSAKNLVQGGESKGRPNPATKPLSSENFANKPGNSKAATKLNSVGKPKNGESEGTNKKSVIQ
jgi:hypothetical protein